MAKVKVKVNKTFSTRDIRKFDAQLVDKYPIVREGETVMMEEEAVRYLQTTIDPEIVEKEGNVKESETRSTKDDSPDSTKDSDSNVDPLYNQKNDDTSKSTSTSTSSSSKKKDSKD